MAINLLFLIMFIISLCINQKATRLQSLSSNELPLKTIAKGQFGSAHTRLRSTETYKKHREEKTQTKKNNKCYNSESNDTLKFVLSKIQDLAINKNASLNVINKNLSHRISLLRNKNVTNKNLSHHISMLRKENVTNKNLSHRISMRRKENVTYKNLSQRNSSKNMNVSFKNVLLQQKETRQKEETKSDTTTVPLILPRTRTDINLSRKYSNVTSHVFSIARDSNAKTAAHRQERDKSGRPLGSKEHMYQSSIQAKADILQWNALIDLKYNNLTSKENQEDKKCSCESTKCDCSNRDLTSIPEDLDTSITELVLSYNSIEKLPLNVFYRYRLLEYLDLYDNSIGTLESGSFNGLSRLQSLDLRFNKFTIIDKPTLEPLKSLKVLRFTLYTLKCNPRSREQETALSTLHNLEELTMDNYISSESVKEFGSAFSNMTSLRHLTINGDKSCKMTQLWNTTFKYLSHITSLNVSKCHINGRYIESEAFSYLKYLQTLDISRNPHIGLEYLPVILWGLRHSGLETLIMNQIVEIHSLNVINSSVVQYLPQNLTTLAARRNNILSIESDAVKTLPKSLKTIDISENDIFTDPEEIPLDAMEGLETLLLHSRYDECLRSDHDFEQDKENMGGKNFGNKKTRKQKMRKVIPKRLKYLQVNVNNMHNYFLADIDERNVLEELDLSCSYLPEFDFGSLEQLPKLRVIDLRKSSVRRLQYPMNVLNFLNILKLGSNDLSKFFTKLSRPFFSFHNLTYLDLSKNEISVLRKTTFERLDNLEFLRLENNPLSHFDSDISNIKQLKLLNLSNTGLSYLPGEVRSHIDHVCTNRPGQVIVDMAGCPIQCDCFNLDFLKWMVSSAAFAKNFTGYKCKYPDTSSKYIIDGYQETIRVLDRECAKNYPMFLIVLAGTSVLLFAVVGAIIYRLRWKIRYLYYAAYLKFTDKHKNDNKHEFTYDVFISYDSEDHAFVTRSLSPELENRGLKLLIHGRDFVAGTYITSNIVMAVTESRKTLVVLTRNLLESTWCNYELQMATMEAVHTGREVLVFLLKEDIPTRELDVELLGHIRSNTYLPYPAPEEEGDEDIMRRFYDKLAHDLRC